MTAARSRSPTPSFAILPVAASCSRRMPSLPRRWTRGCSGSSTATSPTWPSPVSRWSIWESRLAGARFLLGDDFSLADVALLAYTRLAHEGGFDLARLESVRRWIGESERRLGLSPAR